MRVQLDVDLHLNDLSYSEASDRMVSELGFSPEVAEMDLDWYIEYPGMPMGYAVGWKMINLLRDYEMDRTGSNFSLRNFHDKLLSQGSIALPLVIETAFSKKALKTVYSEFRDYIK